MAARHIRARELDASAMASIAEAARRGAASVCGRPATVQIAAEVAVERWEDAVVARRADIADPESWVFRVAANAAKRLVGSGAGGSDGASDLAEATASRLEYLELAARLPAMLHVHRRALTRTQQRVGVVLARPGMTLHEAARVLRMDRSNLRRTFRRLLRILEDTAASDQFVARGGRGCSSSGSVPARPTVDRG